jgi:biotin operon repressor
VALTQKLTDADTREFYCLDCFAEYLGCTTDDLKIKISEFKEQGCTLFL